MTDNWQAFNGKPERIMQDIKLKDGTVVSCCFPKDKSFDRWGQDSDQPAIPVKEIKFVKKHFKTIKAK